MIVSALIRLILNKKEVYSRKIEVKIELFLVADTPLLHHTLTILACFRYWLGVIPVCFLKAA